MSLPAHHKWLLFLILLLGISSCFKKEKNISVEQVDPNTTQNIRAVYFVDDQTGFIGGGDRYFNGTIARTTDGGNTWQSDSVLNKIVFDLFFLDEDRGFAACLDGKILQTKDGGLTWITHQTSPWVPLLDIFFYDDSLGFAVGGGGYRTGVIVKTTDGGNSWASSKLGRELRSIYMVDDQKGFAAGYGILMETQDQGATWDTTNLQGDFFKAFCFPTPETGFLLGNNGTIYKTTDSGGNWDRIRNGRLLTNSSARFNSMYFTDLNTGFIVGNKGLFLKTNNGGSTWVKVKTNTNIHLQDVSSLSGKYGFIVGEDGTLFNFNEKE